MQVTSLNTYYEVYKTKQLNKIVDKIKKDKDSLYNYKLDELSFEKDVCISLYENGTLQPLFLNFNKSCISGDKIISEEYINKFIDSNSNEDTYFTYFNFSKSKVLIKALKYDDDTYVFLYTSIMPLDSTKMLIKSQYAYIMIVLVLISIVLAYFISKIISKPIVELSLLSKQFANGKFDTNFKINSGIKEINDLSESLEKAQKELSKLDELRKDLMANVGHDLKTPLTMIKAYAEMTRDLENQTVEKRRENLNIIIEETDRLNTLVSDILDLSKIQSKTYELKMEEFDLNQLIKNIIRRYYILIDNEGYEFIYNNNNEIRVRADKKRIEQVIYNLINNAVNYTGQDKKIYIYTKEEKNKIVVEIKDTGKGIDEKEIDYIWNKYYHNEKKHKRNAYGTGLGLSIVKTILETHGYKYGVKSKKNKGTTFYFEIDKNKKNML